MVDVCPSPSQVKKAGRTLRHRMRSGELFGNEFSDALEVLLAYRAAHATPLVTANMGLRSMVKSEGCEARVSQRLKRVPTILEKLIREPTLPLSSMQDIGGVRAILASVDELRRVEARVRKRRPPIAVSDYVTNPRDSGYRGVHLVVDYSGRRIEVQLRTTMMHAWAVTVEGLSGRLGENLKGDGNHVVQQLLKAISEAMAIEEQGGTVEAVLLTEMDRLRTIAGPYLR